MGSVFKHIKKRTVHLAFHVISMTPHNFDGDMFWSNTKITTVF